MRVWHNRTLTAKGTIGKTKSRKFEVIGVYLPFIHTFFSTAKEAVLDQIQNLTFAIHDIYNIRQEFFVSNDDLICPSVFKCKLLQKVGD